MDNIKKYKKNHSSYHIKRIIWDALTYKKLNRIIVLIAESNSLKKNEQYHSLFLSSLLDRISILILLEHIYHIHINLNLSEYTVQHWYIKVKLAALVEGDPKVPFSIATTPKCRVGHYWFS